MKCKKCNKDYFNPYINTKYCSKTCENNDINKPEGVVKDLFDIINKNAR